MIHDVNYYQRQLNIAKRNEELDENIANSRCPICNGKIQYIFHAGGGDSIVIPFRGEIRCTKCNMFKHTVERNSYDSYHWSYDGSSEVALKSETYNAVRYYLKEENPEEEHTKEEKPNKTTISYDMMTDEKTIDNDIETTNEISFSEF